MSLRKTVRQKEKIIHVNSRDVKTPEGRNPTGFSDLPTERSFPLALVKDFFCLEGQKSRLVEAAEDCASLASLKAGEVNTEHKDALDLLNPLP